MKKIKVLLLAAVTLLAIGGAYANSHVKTNGQATTYYGLKDPVTGNVNWVSENPSDNAECDGVTPATACQISTTSDPATVAASTNEIPPNSTPEGSLHMAYVPF